MAEVIEKVVTKTSPRRRLQGVVLPSKMEKTIVVQTENVKPHAKYGKRVSKLKKYKVHDADCLAKVGDVVIIEECRPISHDKRFRLVSVVKKGE